MADLPSADQPTNSATFAVDMNEWVYFDEYNAVDEYYENKETRKKSGDMRKRHLSSYMSK